MLKGKIVYLRLLEPEDYELTYKWRCDENYQNMICAPIRFNSKELERNWAKHYSTNDSRDMYLAICLVENDKMIGWYSINDIDYRNRKCFCGGIVVGDKIYKDGLAYQEAGVLAFCYIMEELNMNRVTGACLRENIVSRADMEASFWKLEGVERQAVFKNGKYHDVFHYAILRDEYYEHVRNGDYEDKIVRVGKIIRRLRKEMKEYSKDS